MQIFPIPDFLYLNLKLNSWKDYATKLSSSRRIHTTINKQAHSCILSFTGRSYTDTRKCNTQVFPQWQQHLLQLTLRDDCRIFLANPAATNYVIVRRVIFASLLAKHYWVNKQLLHNYVAKFINNNHNRLTEVFSLWFDNFAKPKIMNNYYS